MHYVSITLLPSFKTLNNFILLLWYESAVFVLFLSHAWSTQNGTQHTICKNILNQIDEQIKMNRY